MTLLNDSRRPALTPDEINKISVLGLAHVGDAVYELLVRSWLCTKEPGRVSDIHGKTVEYVNATAQAAAAERILPALSEAEHAVFRRGRNAKVNSVPHNSTIAEYHFSTGLETLFGWLYLSGEEQRIEELFHLCTGE
ncbi:MAG: ribonuclease III [Oscillospiraceae bacterium]|nr:ribonuclease III [Oscillospiraceae bacterium]